MLCQICPANSYESWTIYLLHFFKNGNHRNMTLEHLGTASFCVPMVWETLILFNLHQHFSWWMIQGSVCVRAEWLWSTWGRYQATGILGASINADWLKILLSCRVTQRFPTFWPQILPVYSWCTTSGVPTQAYYEVHQSCKWRRLSQPLAAWWWGCSGLDPQNMNSKTCDMELYSLSSFIDHWTRLQGWTISGSLVMAPTHLP